MILEKTDTEEILRIKIKIAKPRQKLNRVWEMYQTTNSDVLAAGVELDRLCNKYDRLINKNR